MKIKVGRNELFDGLKKVQPAANAKSVLQILGYVKIEASDGVLTLTTTDCDITLCTKIKADVIEPGVITIPISRIIPTIGAIEPCTVEITTDSSYAHIIGNQFRSRITALPADDFPKLPDCDSVSEFKIQASELRSLLKMTSYAQSTDDTRRALKGVFLATGDGKIRCVASDGRRLALAEKELHGDSENREYVIPSRSVSIIQSFLSEECEVTVKSLGTQIVFSTDDGNVIHTKLVDSSYPNYQQVIPKDEMQRVEIDRETFISVIRRVSVLTAGDTSSIKISFSTGRIDVSAKSDDQCTAADWIAVKYDGESFESHFNPKFILDNLTNTTADVVEIEIKNGNSPAKITSGLDGLVYVIMPLRVS